MLAGQSWRGPNASCQNNLMPSQPPLTAEQRPYYRDDSLSPWAYEYNPYTVQRGDAPRIELAAFEVCDAEGKQALRYQRRHASGSAGSKRSAAASAPKASGDIGSLC